MCIRVVGITAERTALVCCQYPEGEIVAANLWFRNAPDGEMLREMKHTSDTFERILSLLIVPKFEPRWAQGWEDREYDTYDRFIERGQYPVR